MAGSPDKALLLEKWRYESEWPKRLELLQELVENGIFPNNYVDEYEKEGGLYPDLEDPTFLPKLMRKAEFQELMQPSIGEDLESGVDKCRESEDFELSPVQRFVSRLLSPRTPYHSALLFHGVGVGKTCAAVTVCESFLQAYPERECFIVAPATIQEGFKRTIFNSDKETLKIPEEEKPNSHRGCTGDLYLQLTDTLMTKNRAMIQARVTKLVNKRYKFFGYTSFANYIEDLIKEAEKIEDPEDREVQKNIILRNEFSNRVLIIDEAHNLRDNPLETREDAADDVSVADRSDAAAGKKLTPLLKDVLKTTDGTSLVLMTATPMYNSYLEIVFLLNLLLLNDKYPELRIDDVFDRRTGDFKPDGRVLLGYIVSCYLSFMRGENPLTFPVRLPPKGRRLLASATAPLPARYPTRPPKGEAVIDDQERKDVVKLPFLAASFSAKGEAEYKELADEVIASPAGLGITNLDILVQAGNWLFPAGYGQEGFNESFEKEYVGTSAVFASDEGSEWLHEERLGDVSAKAKLLLERLKNVRGVSFVYSRFVASGALSIALALEANGYTMAGRETGLWSGGVKHPKGRQCALCPRKEVGHGAVAAEDGTPAHSFKPAKYVLLTGSEELSPNNKQAIDLARNIKNKNGEDVKVVIGSQIAGEGLDLRFIREVFVFDSWYHLNKLEQIVGRGIRNCSHSALDEEKRNCTVTLLVNTYALPSNIAYETVDTYSYRLALRKAKQIGIVTRVLKEFAMDCTLNHDAIVMQGLQTWDEIKGKPMLDSQGKSRPGVNLNDTPLTALCDWLDECDYPCRTSLGEPFEKRLEEGKMTYEIDLENRDTSTYDEYAARNKISQIKKFIETLVLDQDQPFIRMDTIASSFSTIPSALLASVIQEIVQEREFRVFRGDRRGRIIFRNGFLVFQPDALADIRIPIALRLAHIPLERDSYGKYPGKAIELPPEVDIEERGDNAEDSSELWAWIQGWTEMMRENTVDIDEVPVDILTEVSKLRESAGVMVGQKQRLEMILWVYKSLTTQEQKEVFADVVLEFIWDEFLTDSTKEAMFIETPNDEIVRKVSADSFWDVKGVHAIRWAKSFKRDEEIKEESKKNSGDPLRLVEYLVLPDGADKATKPSVGILEILKRESGRPEFDPLVREGIKAGKTGFEYGFINYQPKENRVVFKKGRPPEGKTKVGKGAECSGNSSTGVELNRLLLYGTTLKESKGYDLGFNETELGARRIANSIRVCTASNLMLRYMDKVRAKGMRWFYRPLEVALYKHPLR